MRLPLLILVVATVSGCAGPGGAPGGDAEGDAADGPPGKRLAPVPAEVDACAAHDCVQHWWNATLTADGPLDALVPLPLPQPGNAMAYWEWLATLRVQGATAEPWEGPHGYAVRVRGEGTATLAAHVVTAREREDPEGPHLEWRWAGATDARAPRIPLWTATPTDARLTYDVRAAYCGRADAYGADAATTGWTNAAGTSVETCH